MDLKRLGLACFVGLVLFGAFVGTASANAGATDDGIEDIVNDIIAQSNSSISSLLSYLEDVPTVVSFNKTGTAASVGISTDKTEYIAGETMLITITLANPTEEWQSVYFAWRLDIPEYGYQSWIMVKPLYLPPDYEQTVTIPFVLGDYGFTFNASWYVAFYDTTTLEVFSEDAADWKYVIPLPAITNINVIDIAENSVTVHWETDVRATSQVEYGKTPDYGFNTTLDVRLSFHHYVTIDNLELGTTYHFRVKSKDKAGTEATSEDKTFTTLAQVTIIVHAPTNTPEGEVVWMRTGVLFGAEEVEVPMTQIESNVWRATVGMPTGSIMRYRYSREGDWDREESYMYRDGIGFHYRELFVQGSMEVEETIAKWEDLPLPDNAVGTLRGMVTNASTGEPVMGLIVSAGPYQTHTRWDGSYRIYGVPAGPCSVTVRAPNGEYAAQVAQITIPANGTENKDFSVTAAPMVQITFRMRVPSDTPEGGVPRLYGDTHRLGMFPGFESSGVDTSRMIDMESAGNGVWTYTTSVGQGTFVQYLYTLGDFIINREYDQRGKDVTRGFLVTGDEVIEDEVVAWKAPYQVPLTLVVQSPTSDTVYFTSSTWDGYEPIRMWSHGNHKWRYVWYVSPGSNVSYRYLRNGDPAIGVEKLSPDSPDSYRQVSIATSGVTQNDTITRWRHQLHESFPAEISLHENVTIPQRVSGQPFQTGVEFIDYWRTSWFPLVEPSADRLVEHNVRWAQIASVWGIISMDPPIVEQRCNSFPTEEELVYHIRVLHDRDLKVALRAYPYPSSSREEAGFNCHHTNDWYDAFFDEVKAAFMYHARIAQQEDVEMLILPNFYFHDGDNPSSAAYINQKWKDVIAEIREVYSRPITTDNYYAGQTHYDWYGDLDYLGDIWWEKLADTDSASFDTMKTQALQVLEDKYLPIYQKFNKPFIFTEVAYYSADGSATQQYGVYSSEISDFEPESLTVVSDWQEQADAYEAVLGSFAETPWVQGAYPFAYAYFDFDSKGYSIRAKTSEEVTKLLYAQINAAQ
jgi:hypothetical protein